jgi:HAMP domain-containing protein
MKTVAEPSEVIDRGVDRPTVWGPVLVGAVLAVFFYAGAFWLRGIRVPIGDDSFFYVSAIRTVSRLGMATSHLQARPAYPLLGAALASVTRSSPWATAVALPFAMAAGLGAAGAALAGRWGMRRWALASFIVLAATSVVVGRLVAGRSENLLTVWFLASALAVWAWGGGRTGRFGTGLLVFAAGLTEWPFVAAFLAILGCALLAERLFPRRTGEDVSSLRGLAIVSLIAAAGVALVVFVVNGTGPADAVQRLPPATRFRPFLVDTLVTFMPHLTIPAVLAGWLAARSGDLPSLRAMRWLLTTWLLITVLVVVAGLAGLPLPTYRAITFALPVPLAMAAAPLLPFSLPGGDFWGRGTRVLVASVLALAAVVPGATMWYRSLRPRTNAEELAQMVAVGRYATTLPAGTPVVVSYDDPDVLKALYYEGVLDAVLPAGLRGRVQLFPGSAMEALAGIPNQGLDPAEREVIRAQFEDVRAALGSGAPVLALSAFDLAGFLRGLVADAPRIGSHAVVVRGPAPHLRSPPPDAFVPLPPGWVLLVRSVAMLAVLALVGLGLSALVLPGATPAVRLALAPAFGAASIGVLALAAVRVGLTPATWAGPGIVVASLAASALAGRWSRRSRPAE